MHGKIKMYYDIEGDLFVARAEGKYNTSEDTGQFIFDLDKDRKVIGLQMFGAPKSFNVSPKHLEHIISGKVDVKVTGGRIEVKIQLELKDGKNTEIVTFEKTIQEYIKDSELSVAVA